MNINFSHRTERLIFECPFFKNREEVFCLGVQLYMFYGKPEQKLLTLLSRFTHNTDDFNPLDLIAEMEAATKNKPMASLFHG